CMLLVPISGMGLHAYGYSSSGSDHETVKKNTQSMRPQITAAPRPTGAIGTSGLYFIENKGQILDQHNQKREDIDFRLVSGSNVNIFIGGGHVHYQWNSLNPDNGQVHSY